MLLEDKDVSVILQQQVHKNRFVRVYLIDFCISRNISAKYAATAASTIITCFPFGLYVKISSAGGTGGRSGIFGGSCGLSTTRFGFGSPSSESLLKFLFPSIDELVAIGCFGANLKGCASLCGVGFIHVKFIGFVTEERDSIDNFSLHLFCPTEIKKGWSANFFMLVLKDS